MGQSFEKRRSKKGMDAIRGIADVGPESPRVSKAGRVEGAQCLAPMHSPKVTHALGA
jgi:hypothetical protein